MVKQLYLKARVGEPPILTLRDMQSPDETTADLIELPGATIEAASRFDKDSSSRACARVAELCRAGVAAQTVVDRVHDRSTVMGRLLNDLLAYVKGASPLSADSAETLIVRVMSELDSMLPPLPPLPEPEYKQQEPGCEGAPSISA